jgi:hypothetical protein
MVGYIGEKIEICHLLIMIIFGDDHLNILSPNTTYSAFAGRDKKDCPKYPLDCPGTSCFYECNFREGRGSSTAKLCQAVTCATHIKYSQRSLPDLTSTDAPAKNDPQNRRQQNSLSCLTLSEIWTTKEKIRV